MAPRKMPTTSQAVDPAGKKAEPRANKVAKMDAAKKLQKTIYDKVKRGKYTELPKMKPIKASRYPKKAVDRMSGKAAHYRRLYPEQFYDAWPEKGKEFDGSDGKNHLDRLPQNLRKKIWALLVVEDNFIWPTSETSRMQPDIARTCTKYRQEVLSIYYSENTFAWDLDFQMPAPGSKLSPVVAFANSLESQLLKRIRNWAFVMDVEIPPDQAESPQDEDGTPRDRHKSKPDWQTIIYKLQQPKPHSQRRPSIEIHRDVSCLMDHTAEPCELNISPDRFYANVIEAMWTHNGRHFTPKVLFNLTAYLHGAAADMLAYRCNRDERPSHERLPCALLDKAGKPVPNTDIATIIGDVDSEDRSDNEQVTDSIELVMNGGL